jgi:hypothetical protein
MAEIFPFQWQVHTRGYQWVDVAWSSLMPPEDRPGTLWCLVPTLGEDAQLAPVQCYRPLQDATGLFRTFANTAPTREELCTFATQYGLLGGDIDRAIMLPWPQEPHRVIPIRGEPFQAWVYELLLMRQVIALWDMARKNSQDGLTRHIRWYGNDRVYYQSTPRMPTTEPSEVSPRRGLKWDTSETPHLDIREWIAAPWYHQELLAGLMVDDLITPTLCYIQRVVNMHVEKLVAPRMLWDSNWKGLHLRFMPRNLRGALWLQCAQAIDGNKDYRQCPESRCKAWFELTPQIARSDKLFCSEACRTRAYRERQRFARRLHAGGMPLHAIVEQVGSDVETVQKWLRLDS